MTGCIPLFVGAATRETVLRRKWWVFSVEIWDKKHEPFLCVYRPGVSLFKAVPVAIVVFFAVKYFVTTYII